MMRMVHEKGPEVGGVCKRLKKKQIVDEKDSEVDAAWKELIGV